MLLLSLQRDAAHPLGFRLLAGVAGLAAVLAAALGELLLLHGVLHLHLLGSEAVVLFIVFFQLHMGRARVDDAALGTAHHVVLLSVLGGLLGGGACLLLCRRALLRSGLRVLAVLVVPVVLRGAAVVLPLSVLAVCAVLPVLAVVLAVLPPVVSVVLRSAAVILTLPVLVPLRVLRGAIVFPVVRTGGLLGGGSFLRRGLRRRSLLRGRFLCGGLVGGFRLLRRGSGLRLLLHRHRHLRLAAGSKVIVQAGGGVALGEALEHDVKLLLGEGRHVLLRLPAVFLQRVKDLLVRDVQILGDLVDSVFNHQ